MTRTYRNCPFEKKYEHTCSFNEFSLWYAEGSDKFGEKTRKLSKRGVPRRGRGKIAMHRDGDYCLCWPHVGYYSKFRRQNWREWRYYWRQQIAKDEEPDRYAKEWLD